MPHRHSRLPVGLNISLSPTVSSWMHSFLVSHHHYNMLHSLVTWRLTQIRPVTHFEKRWFDLKSQSVIQSENYPNALTNHHLTDNTLVADVISHSLSHIVDLLSAETVNAVKVLIEAGRMRGKLHHRVSLT